MSIKIPINIINSENKTDIVYFRALLAYDFIWSDLVVRLLDDAGELVALGQNKFNKNEIVALQLPSGNYTLEIFEPQALEQEELHHCSQFSFSVCSSATCFSHITAWYRASFFESNPNFS